MVGLKSKAGERLERKKPSFNSHRFVFFENASEYEGDSWKRDGQRKRIQ